MSEETCRSVRLMASLYLHIPFCEHKCIYCDFYSIAPNEGTSGTELPTGRFLSALGKEIELRGLEKRFRAPFETVFFGGGTPSLLSPLELRGILARLSTVFAIQTGAEITLETNPGTVDRARLEAFRALGINRLSIGIQSFHDDDLKFLTRIHSSSQAKRCVDEAYAAGFENVSIDLIFSLPSQTHERWMSNLRQALELNPTHISSYSLIVEPNTPLSTMVKAGQVVPLSVDEDADLYETTMRVLEENGYRQYEVSNFARPGYESRHNKAYWNHSHYLGFGPSAHSFWSMNGDNVSPERWWNVSNLSTYHEKLEQGRLAVWGRECLTPEQLLEEKIFLGLRSDGIDIAGVNALTGNDFLAAHRSRVIELTENGLAVVEEGKLRLTSRGYLLCDEICASFRV